MIMETKHGPVVWDDNRCCYVMRCGDRDIDVNALPDLLAALHLLMSDPSRKALLPDTVLAARAAIAKATQGEQ